jgi:5-methylcytosine-specific restriction enzyme subunit McrC
MIRTITVYEHAVLRTDVLSRAEHKTLQEFHGAGDNFPYFTLVHNGVKFSSYVGVLRVGRLTIEILPKTDRHFTGTTGEEGFWRSRLLDMLRVAHDLPVHAPSTSHLRSRPNEVLHLYLEIFLRQLESLHRRGLHRAYHGERTNATSLSGRLLFSEQLRHNLVHKERFFVARDRYDFATPHNRILRMGLVLAAQLNERRDLSPRFASLLAAWPELEELPVNEAFFQRLRYDRATRDYRPVVAIARLLLLRHHPSLHDGNQELLALLFDANRLWETFLERTLRRYLPHLRVTGQSSTAYWESDRHGASTLRPDITISDDSGNTLAILDAKWKVPSNERPSSGDLQQLYTYAHHLNAPKVALLYPATGARPKVRGQFLKSKGGEGRACDVLFLTLAPGLSGREWQRRLGEILKGWLIATI